MKYFVLILYIMFCSMLLTFTIEIENPPLQIADRDGYVMIEQSGSTIYDEIAGVPALPLNAKYIEIPSNMDVANISIFPINEQIIKLNNLPSPVQKNNPLSKHLDSENFNKTLPDGDLYQQAYAGNWIYNFNTAFLGSKKILFFSWYSSKFNPQTVELINPELFSIDIDLVDSSSSNLMNENYTTQMLLKNLQLQTRDTEILPVYLLIYPESFSQEIQPLLDWRYQQGIEVYSISVETISNQYSGIDLQDKIRNGIIDFYQSSNVSHVTLVGDVNRLPDRKLFAFDCQYGAYDDENDIPADIYYSGLNGNWDENGNGIYGELDDNPDFLPEVFVSRIPADASQELTNYLTMLIPYEKGNFSQLNNAGGFSMELWPESNSFRCQQFIYDKYFPENYQIDFIYHEANTTENAYEIINSNRNIVQHTGHAGKTILSLQDGYIRNENLENLANDWGGIFYSIGCWSAALDYNSIGENLVTWPEHGFLGYVGNSRYGWGAPSAPGFGFSEFYQKEFMRLIFDDEITSLAELNALQKTPFIPYWIGTSVYKWCGYELNALGDSFFRILTQNPSIFSYQLVQDGNAIQVQISHNGSPLEDVIVTCGNEQFSTDASGIAVLHSISASEISLYKFGFSFQTIPIEEIESKPYISSINNLNDIGYLQGFHSDLSLLLVNPTSNQLQVYTQYVSNPDFVDLSWSESVLTIDPNSTIDLPQLDFYIKSVNESQQLPDDFQLPVMMSIVDVQSKEIITTFSFDLTINSPELDISEFVYNSPSLSLDEENQFKIQVKNTGEITMYNLSIEFESDDLQFAVNDVNIVNLLNPTDTLTFYNSWTIPSNIEQIPQMFSINLSTELDEQIYTFTYNYFCSPGDIALEESFENSLNWQSDPYWQQVDTYAYDGDFSLSCRPDIPGSFDIKVPALRWLDDGIISFQYRYKMPMYGKDGVYFILQKESILDTLLFLGAGGALPKDLRDNPLVYIESDWIQYNLDIAENSSIDMLAGDVYNLILRFVYSEEIADFTQYGLMNEIGIFIDNFTIGEKWLDFEQPFEDEVSINLYPNPLSDFHWLAIDIRIDTPQPVDIEIYNIKGEKIESLYFNDFLQGKNILYWDKKDKYGRNVASGIYLLKIKVANREYYRKIVLLT